MTSQNCIEGHSLYSHPGFQKPTAGLHHFIKAETERYGITVTERIKLKKTPN